MIESNLTTDESEVERKFLLPRTRTGSWRSREADAEYMIRQAYIGRPDEDMETRVREKTPSGATGGTVKHTLTVKSGSGMSRVEQTQQITPELFRAVFTSSQFTIQKRRFEHELSGGLTLEIDRFDEPTSDLVMAEVEFDSREEAEAFQPEKHDLISDTLAGFVHSEVTHEESYKNREIAKGALDLTQTK